MRKWKHGVIWTVIVVLITELFEFGVMGKWVLGPGPEDYILWWG